MTISTTESRISYNGNGITTAFTIPFRFLANGDIVVVEVSAAGVETTKTLTTHYTLTGAGDDGGGTVTMLVAPASGTRLIVYRDTEIVQETDYISGDPFPAETHERALDRLTMICQEISPNTDRAIRVPVGDLSTLNTTLPAAVDRLDKFIVFDATTGATELSAVTQTQVASAVAAAYAAGSTADAVTFLQSGTGAVAISVQSKLRQSVGVVDFGAAGDDVTDDYAAFQAAIDEVHGLGGGVVLCSPGRTYLLSTAPVVKDRVTLDLNGATLRLALTGTGGADYGVRVRNYASLINGTINIESSGTVGSQGGIHAAVNVGPLYSDGGTVASPSDDEGVTGWVLRNLKLSTNRTGKVAVQVLGGANNGVIENIEVPDSAVMYGAIHLDWGFLGSIASSDIATSRTNFNAGTAYTTHPNNILIRNIKVGSLSVTKGGTDVGSHLVRLSGVYNVRVENVRGKQCTYAAIRVTAGDCGFEFAQAAIKPLRMKGIVVDGVAVENTTDSWLIYADSYADNVAAAVSGSAYSPLLDPLHETDLEVRHVTGKGSGGASVTAGLEIRQIRGGRFEDIDASGYQYGCLVDEQVFGAHIHGRFHENRGHGIYIQHGTYPPEDVLVMSGTHCYQNGTDAGFAAPAGVAIGASVRCRVDGALLGHRTAASETTQELGIHINSADALDVEVENCHVFSVESGGVAYLVLSSTDYGIVRLFRNNTVASAIISKYSGLNIVPINRFLSSGGAEVVHYTAVRASLTTDTTPMAGAWNTGDTIFHSDPSGSNTGTRCTTGGSPGTWGLF